MKSVCRQNSRPEIKFVQYFDSLKAISLPLQGTHETHKICQNISFAYSFKFSTHDQREDNSEKIILSICVFLSQCKKLLDCYILWLFPSLESTIIECGCSFVKLLESVVRLVK